MARGSLPVWLYKAPMIGRHAASLESCWRAPSCVKTSGERRLAVIYAERYMDVKTQGCLDAILQTSRPRHRRVLGDGLKFPPGSESLSNSEGVTLDRSRPRDYLDHL